MSPYEHFFWNFALFYRKPWAWKVGVGGIFPDLIYMIPFLPRILSYRSYLECMHDPLWDTIWDSLIARSAHSLTIWTAFLILCFIIFKKATFGYAFPFLLGWGLHIAFDALTHVSDGYALFFPCSTTAPQHLSLTGKGNSMPESILGSVIPLWQDSFSCGSDGS